MSATLESLSSLARRQPALNHFNPLLVELVRADAPQRQLRDEGFTDFEVSAVRTLVNQAGHTHHVPAGEARGPAAGSKSEPE